MEARAARAHTRHQLKFTLPGPMTIVDTIADEHYGRRADLAMAFAEALNEEAKELEAIGVDVVQFDEPAYNVYMAEVAGWGIATLERAAQGLSCTTAITNATMPLVIAALLSARKCSFPPSVPAG
jgi:5-methyltetrahydropteroyltriglutamate--homocysteine methyltransferase